LFTPFLSLFLLSSFLFIKSDIEKSYIPIDPILEFSLAIFCLLHLFIYMKHNTQSSQYYTEWHLKTRNRRQKFRHALNCSLMILIKRLWTLFKKSTNQK